MTVNDQPHLCERLQEFGGASVFAEMSALAVRTGAINLGQGFPDTNGPVEVAEAAIEAIRGDFNQYPPGIGYPVLRQAVAEHQKRFWGMEFDPDTEVLITAGATEAITAAILALAGPGDEVVTFEPYFDIYPADISMAGARRRLVQLRPPAYRFDPDELAAAFGPRTRLLLLNSPHNPTGKVFSAEELDVIARLCVEHDVIAVTDEVYEHLTFDLRRVPPCASGLPAGHGRAAHRHPRSPRAARRCPSPAGRSAGCAPGAGARAGASGAGGQAAPHLCERRNGRSSRRWRSGCVWATSSSTDRYSTLTECSRRSAGAASSTCCAPAWPRLWVRAGGARGHLLHHRRHPPSRGASDGAVTWSSAAPCPSCAGLVARVCRIAGAPCDDK